MGSLAIPQSRPFQCFFETLKRSISLLLRNSGRETGYTFAGIAPCIRSGCAENQSTPFIASATKAIVEKSAIRN
jgi:hypothetical protein